MPRGKPPTDLIQKFQWYKINLNTILKILMDRQMNTHIHVPMASKRVFGTEK